MIIRTPSKISQAHFEKLLKTRDILSIKRSDCAGYNSCAGRAEKKSWPQFTCDGCNAFQMRSAEEREHDTLRLLALYGEINCAGAPHKVVLLK